MWWPVTFFLTNSLPTILFPWLTTFCLFSSSVSFRFLCFNLLCLGYRRGMRDPMGRSETCGVEMRINKSTGVRLRDTVCLGGVGWCVPLPFSIPNNVFQTEANNLKARSSDDVFKLYPSNEDYMQCWKIISCSRYLIGLSASVTSVQAAALLFEKYMFFPGILQILLALAFLWRLLK